MVLISARPFRIGDRVRLQGGGLAGQIEGTVASLGLLYVDLRPGRGLDHGPQQRRAHLRGRAAARARRRSTCARACAPTSSPPRSRSCCTRGVRTRSAPSRTSRSRRSTPTRSSSASPPRPSPRSDGPRLADEVLVRDRLGHPRGRHATSARPPAAARRRSGAHGGPQRRRRRRRAHGRALALVALALGQRVGDRQRAEPALHARRELRREPGDRGAEPQRQRRDVDLGRGCARSP